MLKISKTFSEKREKEKIKKDFIKKLGNIKSEEDFEELKKNFCSEIKKILN